MFSRDDVSRDGANFFQGSLFQGIGKLFPGITFPGIRQKKFQGSLFQGLDNLFPGSLFQGLGTIFPGMTFPGKWWNALNVFLRRGRRIYINTTFFRKIYNYFPQNATFFRKLNSALFDRSHCSRRQSDTMCLSRRDWMFAPTIRYQFKRHLFTRRPCTGPHLWAGPEGDCNCWDTGIEISFNFSRSRQFAFVRNACGH